MLYELTMIDGDKLVLIDGGYEDMAAAVQECLDNCRETNERQTYIVRDELGQNVATIIDCVVPIENWRWSQHIVIESTGVTYYAVRYILDDGKYCKTDVVMQRNTTGPFCW